MYLSDCILQCQHRLGNMASASQESPCEVTLSLAVRSATRISIRDTYVLLTRVSKYITVTLTLDHRSKQ